MAQQTKTVMEYCYGCNYSVKISKEEYDKKEGDYGWFVDCSKCEYKNKILKEESDKLNGLTLRPSKFELGKFHIFFRWGTSSRAHYIIDIIKITNCFITYKIRNYGEGEWTKCKRKIDWSNKHTHKIKYPKECGDMDRENISPDDLYRKCD